MGRKRIHVHQQERGQSLVLYALALVVLVSMLALGVDGGYAYAQRRRMQTAADAAALAGARVVALGQGAGQVETAVRQYATNNGAAEYSWQYIGGGRGVRVTAQTTFNTFFAGIVGLSAMTASATAEASLDYLSATGNLLPIAVRDFPFVYGETYTLWDDDHESPGAFGWIDWTPPAGGNNELAEAILNPSLSGWRQIGEWINTQTGVSGSKAVRDALDFWIGKHITVPLYDQVTGTGNNTKYRISGFAEFVLTGYNFHGSDKSVTGYFVRWVESGPGGGTHGVSTVRLTN
jgi:Flp pilus assembly protein TadG